MKFRPPSARRNHESLHARLSHCRLGRSHRGRFVRVAGLQGNAMNPVTFTIPMKAASTANLREHHMVKARRLKSQRQAAMLKCPPWSAGALLVIELTRVGPRELDSDNLASALKSVRDGIAAKLKFDDASKLVRWDYKQAKGEYEIRVRIYRVDDE